MRQRLYFTVGLLMLAVNLSVAMPLKALDLFGALPIARETCGHKFGRRHHRESETRIDPGGIYKRS